MTLAECWQAAWLVSSRAFDLSPCAGDGRCNLSDCLCVMVPFADLFNHPSPSALRQQSDGGAAFRSTQPARNGCIRWASSLGPFQPRPIDGQDAEGLTVRAPRSLTVGEGDEVWNLYAELAPADASEEEGPGGRSCSTNSASSVGSVAAEARFRVAYGFSPTE